MSESGEVGLPLTAEERGAWGEAKERANRCALALVIAFHAVEASPPGSLAHTVAAASAAIDAVEASRRACLDLLEGLLKVHGKGKGSLDEKRRELEQAIKAERDRLAALESSLRA
jgi:hypothetical protein